MLLCPFVARSVCPSRHKRAAPGFCRCLWSVPVFCGRNLFRDSLFLFENSLVLHGLASYAFRKIGFRPEGFLAWLTLARLCPWLRSRTQGSVGCVPVGFKFVGSLVVPALFLYVVLIPLCWDENWLTGSATEYTLLMTYWALGSSGESFIFGFAQCLGLALSCVSCSGCFLRIFLLWFSGV